MSADVSRPVAALGLILASVALIAPIEGGTPAVERHYQIENVPAPAGIDPQVGGLEVLPDGRIAACFHHGQVAILDPATTTWKIFAEGLHQPLGLLAESDGSLFVMQHAELTRLRDTDGDGSADDYETVWAGFGLTGNYHEFAFGPARGPDGKLYVTLNLASNGASIREEIRGPWSPIGLPRERFFEDWSKNKVKAGRMYSRVPWRGWAMRIDPSTGKAEPFASGFRSPDGVGFDGSGRLLITDNQGDWRGANELHVVEPGGFHGHPASLIWREDWDGTDPLSVGMDRLDALRTRPAVYLPQNTYANSPTEPVVIPKTAAWGPYGGQILIGEMNAPQLIRILLEEVDGVWQGACVNLVKSESLKRGLHRLAFSGDTLWVGRTHLAWPGGEGLGTLRPTGAFPFDPLDIRITPRGFRLTFTEALDPVATDPGLWSLDRYTFHYHAAYGSPEVEKESIRPLKVTLGPDGTTAEVELPEVKAGFVHDFDFSRLRSVKGDTPLNPRLAYTVWRVPEE